MQTVSWAGSTYNIPNQRGDTPWSGLSDFAIAVASKGINTAGGNFTLLADINYGATFGIVSTYYKSRSANIATAGILRLASTDTIQWRDNANGGNVSLSKNTSDELLWNGSRIVLAGGGLIVNADISASAAIAFSKMAALTASRALQSSAGGVVEVSLVTSTELGYVSGVSSAIQTQINAKATGTIAAGGANRLAYYTGASAIDAVASITASKALASDANGLPVASATTAAELGFVAGLSSAVQTQINGKANTSLNNVASVSADVPMNSHKFTGLSAGSTSGDSVRFEQLPTVSAWTGYTPTIAGVGTATNVSFFWRQIADEIFVRGTFTMGTVSGTTLSITLPNSSVIATAKMPSSTTLIGFSTELHTGGAAVATLAERKHVFTDGSTTDKVFWSSVVGAGVYTKQTGSQDGATNTPMSMLFSYAV